MRDAKRIALALDLLEHYWHRYPDLRLGQIIGNFADCDPYAFEDDDLIVALDAALNAGEMVA